MLGWESTGWIAVRVESRRVVRCIVRLALVVITGATMVSQSGARDAGQIPPGASPTVRSWFETQVNKRGFACCTLADGHVLGLADVMRLGEGYRVRIAGKWVRVPAEAVISNAVSPLDGAAVWYGYINGEPWVRCFVPPAGA